MTKILVTGASGQLGMELQRIASNYPKVDWVFASRKELDLSELAVLSDRLDVIQPDVVLNCAAYTAVDLAEQEEELADRINHLAVAVLAQWTSAHQAQFLHVSTDYVFAGCSFTPLREADPTGPLNVYGRSKLAGELACLLYDPQSVVVRTSWVYSEFGSNFVKTMLRLMREKDSLKIVADQIGSPTYAADLAVVLVTVALADRPTAGIYHYANQGQVSWFDFATKIQELAETSCLLAPVSSSEFATVAQRPTYSLLDTTKITAVFGIEIPTFTTSLKRCLERLALYSTVF